MSQWVTPLGIQTEPPDDVGGSRTEVALSNDSGVVLHAQHARPEREPPGECAGPRSLPCRTNAWLERFPGRLRTLLDFEKRGTIS